MFVLLSILFGISTGFVINNDPTKGCCDLHNVEATCNAEVGTKCLWMAPTDPRVPYTDDGTQQCVSEQLAACLDKCVATGIAPQFLLRSDVCPPAPTKKIPTCEFEQCTNHEHDYNVQFILDESGSVGVSNYIDSVNFVMNMIKNDVNKPAKVSAFSFSNNPEERYSFQDDQSSRSAVLASLELSKSAYQGQCTDTLSALERGIGDFEDDPLISPADNNYLFLITDGVPYCGCGLPGTCSVEVCGENGYTMRQRLQHYNVRVFTMAIGNFDVTKIECLSDPADIFEVASFSSQDFSRLEDAVRTTLCEVKTPSISQQVMAVLSSPIQSFNESSLLIKSMVILFVAAMIFGVYHKNNKKEVGYQQLEFDADYA